MTTKSKQTTTAAPIPAPTEDQLSYLPCLCGCGTTITKAGRFFRQGHDQRLRGNLQRLHQGGTARATDYGLAHLIDNFCWVGEVYGDTPMAIAIALDALFPEKGGWMVSMGEGGAKVKSPKAPHKTAAQKDVQRKVGRWIKTGTVRGDRFTYINAQGEPVTVELSKTKEV